MFIFCVKPGSGPSSLTRCKVDGVPDSVAELRSKAAEVTGMEIGRFNIVHCGRIMEDGKSLVDYKIGPKSCVHVLSKPPIAEPPLAIHESESSSEEAEAAWTQFMISFGMAVRNPSFSKFAKRLAKRENLENMAAAVPGLDSDPIACAYLSKPDLLMSLLQPETFKYIRAKHPGLIEAANNLAAVIHEEKPTKANDGEAHPLSYHLDEMSDDDDYDEMDMSPANQAGAIQQRGGLQQISAEQLRAALSAAQSTAGIFGGMSGMGPTMGSNMGPTTPSTAGPSTSQPSSGGAITQDQLAAALAAASASASTSGNSGNPFIFPPPPSQPTEPASSAAPNWEDELSKMKEMGITDEGLAKKALEIMGGDLQAAIELIFSGWDGMDESLN